MRFDVTKMLVVTFRPLIDCLVCSSQKIKQKLNYLSSIDCLEERRDWIRIMERGRRSGRQQREVERVYEERINREVDFL